MRAAVCLAALLTSGIAGWPAPARAHDGGALTLAFEILTTGVSAVAANNPGKAGTVFLLAVPIGPAVEYGFDGTISPINLGWSVGLAALGGQLLRLDREHASRRKVFAHTFLGIHTALVLAGVSEIVWGDRARAEASTPSGSTRLYLTPLPRGAMLTVHRRY